MRPQFTLVSVPIDQTYTCMDSGNLDFIFTNPSIMACLQVSYGVQPIVSQYVQQNVSMVLVSS